jgi:hypothetical protein
VVRLEVSFLRVVGSYPAQWASMYVLVGVKVAEQPTEGLSLRNQWRGIGGGIGQASAVAESVGAGYTTWRGVRHYTGKKSVKKTQ